MTIEQLKLRLIGQILKLQDPDVLSAVAKLLENREAEVDVPPEVPSGSQLEDDIRELQQNMDDLFRPT